MPRFLSDFTICQWLCTEHPCAFLFASKSKNGFGTQTKQWYYWVLWYAHNVKLMSELLSKVIILFSQHHLKGPFLHIFSNTWSPKHYLLCQCICQFDWCAMVDLIVNCCACFMDYWLSSLSFLMVDFIFSIVDQLFTFFVHFSLLVCWMESLDRSSLCKQFILCLKFFNLDYTQLYLRLTHFSVLKDHSSSSAWETICSVRNQIPVGFMQGKCFTCCTLSPAHLFLCNLNSNPLKFEVIFLSLLVRYHGFLFVLLFKDVSNKLIQEYRTMEQQKGE